MRIVLQRVSEASVSTGGTLCSSIGRGYMLLLGVMTGDTEEQAAWLAEKILKLRLFDGADGKINDRSVVDIGGGILVVSQFTLAGNLEKGNRPDFLRAAPPDEARRLYEFFVGRLRGSGLTVEIGAFGEMMQVSLVNEGPCTILLEH
ncbi:MAG: D-tyrosyl-tRNA(Tyr) deacylase [Candidatus Peregrinibacteria bacterium GW2011_GWA2_54_9]|nr:MAG: D-tyrosyl-tRNA(Tyr) deacylase [Candidatus Peregrinibacteria bacterium GW2011_GWA2_54_9]